MKNLLILSAMFLFMACGGKKSEEEFLASGFEILSTSEKQWTGIAVDKEQRIFVNYPHWSNDVPISVAEITNGKPIPYPNKAWNNRDNDQSFNAVQSVVVDKKNRLWVVDTNNPKFQGVEENGPILYVFDLDTDRMLRSYTFPSSEWGENSYFNDIRIDTDAEVVYITDSGESGLIVMDIATGNAKRHLKGHPSTMAEIDYLVCDNYLWEAAVHSDGIALSPDNKYLYYIALTGHSLYRIPTKVLREGNLIEQKASIELVRAIPATDGMMFDDKGNLWLGGLENNAVNILTPNLTLKQVLISPEFRWVDSFAKDPEGFIYFATSQIHIPEEERKDYNVIRLNKHILDYAKTQNKILIAVTSHDKLGETNGDPTGYYLSEVSHAYYAFKKAGFEVEFVSPKGGKPTVTGLDDRDAENKQFLEDEEAQQAIENSISAQIVDPSDYSAIYYAGGHGVMWDFADNTYLSEVGQKIYEQGGVVSAVCHGPAGLVNIKLSNNNFLVQGKNIATFTNEEEAALNLDDVVPYALQTKLELQGAIVHTVSAFQKNVKVDQRLVTGQNPASAKGVANSVIKLLGK